MTKERLKELFGATRVGDTSVFLAKVSKDNIHGRVHIYPMVPTQDSTLNINTEDSLLIDIGSDPLITINDYDTAVISIHDNARLVSGNYSYTNTYNGVRILSINTVDKDSLQYLMSSNDGLKESLTTYSNTSKNIKKYDNAKTNASEIIAIVKKEPLNPSSFGYPNAYKSQQKIIDSLKEKIEDMPDKYGPYSWEMDMLETLKDSKEGASKLEKTLTKAKPYDPTIFEKEPDWVPVPIPYIPSNLEYSYLSETGYFRIGYTAFHLPPEKILLNRNQHIELMPLLRSRGSLKRGTGKAQKELQIHIHIPDITATNNVLLPLIRQFEHTPFVPVINSYLNDTLDIDALSLEALQISTVPGFPGAFDVVIQASEFNWSAYLPLESDFDSTICYPIYKIWCETSTKTQPLGPVLNGNMAFNIPNEDYLIAMASNRQLMSEDLMVTTLEKDTQIVANAIDWIDNIKPELYDTFGIYKGDGLQKKWSYQAEDLLNCNGKFTGSLLFIKLAPGTVKVESNPSNNKASAEWRSSSSDSTNTVRANSTGTENAIILKFTHPDTAIKAFQTAEKVYYAPGGLRLHTLPNTDSNGNYLTEITSEDITDGEGRDKRRDSLREARSTVGNATARAKGQAVLNDLDNCYFLYTKSGLNASSPKDTHPLRRSLSNAAGRSTKQKKVIPEVLEKKWERIELDSLIVENVTIGMENIVTNAQLQASPKNAPVQQFMGASDTYTTIAGTITNEADIKSLKELTERVDYLVKTCRGDDIGDSYEGYLYIANELLALAGVTTVLPVNLNIITDQGFPGTFKIEFSCIDFDPMSQSREDLEALDDPNWYIKDIRNVEKSKLETPTDSYKEHMIRAEHFHSKLRSLQLYPDMNLPTYSKLQKWVTDCKAGSLVESSKYRWAISDEDFPWTPEICSVLETPTNISAYVDPDFYVRPSCPPGIVNPLVDPVLDSLLGIVQDPSVNSKVATCGVRSNYNDKATIPFNGKIDVSNDPATLATFKAYAGIMNSMNQDTTSSAGPSILTSDSELYKARTKLLNKVKTVKPGIANSNSQSSPIPGLTPTYDPLAEYSNSTGLRILQLIQKYSKEETGITSVPEIIAINMFTLEGYSSYTKDHDSIGLGQLRKSTAIQELYNKKLITKEEYTKCNGSSTDIRAIDHEFAIRASMLYLEHCYNQIPNIGKLQIAKNDYSKWLIALSAYNAGPGKIRKLVNDGNTKPVTISKLAGVSQQYKNTIAGMAAYDPSKEPVKKTTTVESKDNSKLTWLQRWIGNAKESREEYRSWEEGVRAEVEKTPLRERLQNLNKELVTELYVDKSTPQNIRTFMDSFIREDKQDMFYDMRNYTPANRLLTAFPTYCVLLVDGGRWLRFHRLYDHWYGMTAIQSIEIHKTRKGPVDTALITFSNMFHHLTKLSTEDPVIPTVKWGIQSITQGTVDSLLHNTGDDVFLEWSKHVNSMLLKAGTRVHIRMGSGGNANKLPVVFNGVISEVPPGDEAVTVVALSDGIELDKQLIQKDPNLVKEEGGIEYKSYTWLGQGVQPRELIMKVMTPTRPYDWLKESFKFKQDNPYGIAHFGSPTRSTLFKSEAEVGMNTYRADKKGLLEDRMYAESSAGESYYNILGLLDGIDGSDTKIGLSITDATPWKVIKTCTDIAPEYICAVYPFELRSTLFYGKPHWVLHYEYTAEYLAKAKREEVQYGKGEVAYPENWKPDDVTLQKPFRQVRVISSICNLIDNKIKSSDKIHTICQAMSKFNGTIAKDNSPSWSNMMYLDTDIYPEHQKILYTSSGLYATTAQNAQDILPLNFHLLTGYYTRKSTNNAAVSILMDSVKDMYQGHLVILGDPSIKPYDRAYLADDQIDMYGLIDVKEVTQHFSYESGFITTVSPDLVLSAIDQADQTSWAWIQMMGSRYVSAIAMQQVASILIKTGTLRFVGNILLSAILKLGRQSSNPVAISARNILLDTLLSPIKTLKEWKGIGYEEMIKRMTAGDSEIIKAVDKGLEKYGPRRIKDLATNKHIIKAKAYLGTSWTKFKTWHDSVGFIETCKSVGKEAKASGIKAAFTKIKANPKAFATAGKRIKLPTASASIVKAIKNGVWIILAGGIVEWLNRGHAARQALILRPLLINGKPFTAGINGHAGSVLGDEIGVWDGILSALTNWDYQAKHNLGFMGKAGNDYAAFIGGSGGSFSDYIYGLGALINNVIGVKPLHYDTSQALETTDLGPIQTPASFLGSERVGTIVDSPASFGNPLPQEPYTGGERWCGRYVTDLMHLYGWKGPYDNKPLGQNTSHVSTPWNDSTYGTKVNKPSSVKGFDRALESGMIICLNKGQSDQHFAMIYKNQQGQWKLNELSEGRVSTSRNLSSVFNRVSWIASPKYN